MIFRKSTNECQQCANRKIKFYLRCNERGDWRVYRKNWFGLLSDCFDNSFYMSYVRSSKFTGNRKDVVEYLLMKGIIENESEVI